MSVMVYLTLWDWCGDSHCPHEEVSESFVQAISEWMDENNETRSVVDSESTRAESIA